jgi:hypothetical protein
LNASNKTNLTIPYGNDLKAIIESDCTIIGLEYTNMQWNIWIRSIEDDIEVEK